MKKLYFKALLLCLCLFASINAFAYDAYVKGIYYNFSGDEAIVTYRNISDNSYSGAVVIPESVIYNNNAYNVKGIGSFAFQNCKSLQAIIIPNSVTSIGSHAFDGCTNLTYFSYGEDTSSSGGNATDLQNGDFEKWVSASEPLGWKSASTASNATLSQSTDAHNGSYACRIAAPGNQNKRLATQEMTLEAGTYTLSFYAKSTTADVCQIKGGYVPIWDDGTVGAYKYGDYVDINNNRWTLVSYEFTLAEATKLCILVMNPKNSSYSVSQDILVDDVQLTSIPANVKQHLIDIDKCSFDGSCSLSIIGEYAFASCRKLNSIIIPNSVTNIGEGAFQGCISLTAINIPENVTSIGNSIFKGCSSMTTITIPNSVTDIGDYAFQNSGLTSITIPESVTNIGSNAFEGCISLSSVIIPRNVTNINNYTFQNCSTLITVNFSGSVINIGDYAFSGCSDLTSVSIPESVTSIGSNAFEGCSSLASLVIPSGVTRINNSTFQNCSSLITVTIPESVTNIGDYAFFGCSNLPSIAIPNSVTSIGSSAFSGCLSLASIFIPKSIMSIGSNAFESCNNIRFNVSRGSFALFYVWNNFESDPYEIGTDNKLSRPSISAISTTQTTITYQINNVYPELEYEVGHESVGENIYLITGLRPDYTQNIPLAVHSGNNLYRNSANLTTLPISPIVTSKNITASSLTVEGSYTEGDARVVSTLLTINGTEMEGIEGTMHGLKPNTSYTCKYTVVVEYGNGETYSYEGSAIIRTAVLTLTTQQPKVINVGNVIVSAESNLDDEETNVGFEWRRTDWTDEFASNTGTAYLFEGKMEGYIRNLYTEKLWKYRPYYESDSGNRYYGEWVGIDPTNTSYFEPTVHTYAPINVTGNKAEVKGYAMRGTDNVQSQGFMYWPSSTSVSLRKRASVPGGAMVVNASGYVMTATLEDLEYETTYKYVAFVTTSEGETFYGEIQTFTTSFNPDGIEEVKASEDAIEIARYDIQGRMIAKPQKGINIIRYSDGTSKKVLVK